jgi:hypothetical protein
VAEIVRALQGEIVDVPRVTGSAASEAWGTGAAALEQALGDITLAELARRQREIDSAGAEAAVYFI